MKNSKGITLIALIITIVVLLILAAVTINLTMGENGLLKKVETAGIEQKKAEYDEQIKILIIEAKIEKQNGNTRPLIEIIKNKIKEKNWAKQVLAYDINGIIVENNGIELIVTAKDDYEIGIEVKNDNAQIEYINNKLSGSFTITYNSNDGKNQTITQEIREGRKATLRANLFTRDNYSFVGWIEEQDSEMVYQENASYPNGGITKDITLYAKWSLDTVNITYKGNGGKLENEDTQISARIQANSKIILPENTFTSEGYKFVCWLDLNNIEYHPGDEYNVLEENIELSAKWEQNLQVGDYVNYGIDYDNVFTFHSAGVPEEKYTGWRILSVEGEGENQYIKLISAGMPINYCHKAEQSSVENLTTKFFETPINTTTLTKYNFYSCGFKASNGNAITDITSLKNLFAANTYTDVDNTGKPKVQSMTKDDVDNICGTTIDKNNKLNNDLLCLSCTNGITAVTWMATEGINENHLWYIYYEGTVLDATNNETWTFGIRPVVTLKKGVKFILAEDHINDTTTWDITF